MTVRSKNGIACAKNLSFVYVLPPRRFFTFKCASSLFLLSSLQNYFIIPAKGCLLVLDQSNPGLFAISLTVKSVFGLFTIEKISDLSGLRIFLGAYLTDRPSKCPKFYTNMISGDKRIYATNLVNFVNILIATNCRNF